jgi:phospholipid/cholesterol/gamma-HCH transport system substrate-binding protein
MEYKSSEIKAGMFIFFGFLGLFASIFVLGDIKDYFQPKKELKIFFGFAGGLDLGAPVTYAGLEVGRVKHIKLLGAPGGGQERVSVLAEISPDINIKTDSSASIKTSGLMGGFYIDIRPGTKEASILKASDHLMGQESFEFAKVGDMVADIVREVHRFTDLTENLVDATKNTLQTAQASLEGFDQLISENKSGVTANLANLSQISSEMAEILSENRKNIDSGMYHFASATAEADRLLTEKSATIIDIIDQIQRFSRDMEILVTEVKPGVKSLVNNMDEGTRKVTSSIDLVAGEMDDTLHQGNSLIVENRRNLLLLVRNLRETSENLKGLSSDLERNPWKLVRKSDEMPVTKENEAHTANLTQKLRMKRLDKISER